MLEATPVTLPCFSVPGEGWIHAAACQRGETPCAQPDAEPIRLGFWDSVLGLDVHPIGSLTNDYQFGLAWHSNEGEAEPVIITGQQEVWPLLRYDPTHWSRDPSDHRWPCIVQDLLYRELLKLELQGRGNETSLRALSCRYALDAWGASLVPRRYLPWAEVTPGYVLLLNARRGRPHAGEPLARPGYPVWVGVHERDPDYLQACPASGRLDERLQPGAGWKPGAMEGSVQVLYTPEELARGFVKGDLIFRSPDAPEGQKSEEPASD